MRKTYLRKQGIKYMLKKHNRLLNKKYMGWSKGYDNNWKREIGYGVEAVCDHPKCNKKIDRGLSYVCGGQPYGGEHGCGLYFCSEHLSYRDVRGVGFVQNCPRCLAYKSPYKIKE